VPGTELVTLAAPTGEHEVSGWIVKHGPLPRRCIAALREGTLVLARVVASWLRLDPLEAGKDNGCHSSTMPPSLFDGGEHLPSVVEDETDLRRTFEPIRCHLERIADPTVGWVERSETHQSKKT
jgi:hypothetical protein